MSLLSLPPELLLKILTHVFNSTIPPSRLIKPRYFSPTSQTLHLYPLYRLTSRPDSHRTRLPKNWNAVSYTCQLLKESAQDVLFSISILEIYVMPRVSEKDWLALNWGLYSFLARTKGMDFSPRIGTAGECEKWVGRMRTVKVWVNLICERDLKRLEGWIGSLCGSLAVRGKVRVVVGFGELSRLRRDARGYMKRRGKRQAREKVEDGVWEEFVGGMKRLMGKVRGEGKLVVVVGKLWVAAEGRERFEDIAGRIGARLFLDEREEVSDKLIDPEATEEE